MSAEAQGWHESLAAGRPWPVVNRSMYLVAYRNLGSSGVIISITACVGDKGDNSQAQ